jgi:hypothetical protein
MTRGKKAKGDGSGASHIPIRDHGYYGDPTNSDKDASGVGRDKGKKAANATKSRSGHSGSSGGSSVNNYEKMYDVEDTGTSKRKGKEPKNSHSTHITGTTASKSYNTADTKSHSSGRRRAPERNHLRPAGSMRDDAFVQGKKRPDGTPLLDQRAMDIHRQTSDDRRNIIKNHKKDRNNWVIRSRKARLRGSDSDSELRLPSGAPSSGHDSAKGERQRRPKRQRSDASGPSKPKRAK